MPDSTPTPSPTPSPVTPRTRGDINQAWLDEMTRSDEVAATAAKTAYAGQLATGGIDDAKVDGLANAVKAARLLAAAAVQNTTGKQGVTTTETALTDDLINQIQNVQKRAKQKHEATAPGKLADYAIGQKFYSSRAVLEQTAANILAKLKGTAGSPADVLPGIDAAKITALQTAADAYQAVQTNQSGAQGDATTARKQLEAAIADLTAKRREIQFAADAEWPHTAPANAGVRTEFQLPTDRVMK